MSVWPTGGGLGGMYDGRTIKLRWYENILGVLILAIGFVVIVAIEFHGDARKRIRRPRSLH